MSIRILRTFILTTLLLRAAATWSAQYYVERLEPRGGQRGTTVDVIFYGTLLNDPKDVIFYRPGIEAIDIQPVIPPAPAASAIPAAKDAAPKTPTPITSVKARFRIKPDCPLGEHPLRLRTGHALTDCVTFWVGPFPVVQEKETKLGENDTPETAQPIPLNVTVYGQIHPGDAQDVDCYCVEMKKGQRLSVEVECARLGTLHRGGEADLAVRVLDKFGKEIAKCDDSALFLQDPVLSTTILEDGSYVVEIGQQTYYAPSTSYYRAHIGTFVRPTAVYPLGGPAGTKINARLLGDATGGVTQEIDLPKQTGDFEFFAGKDGEQPPSANVLRVSSYPNVMEVEPNDTPETATVVPSLPAALNGIIEKPGDVDCFKIHVEKGSNWRVRVYAHALGTPLDAKIWIRPVGSTSNELEKDDSTLAERDHLQANGRWRTADLMDPSTLFPPRQTGDYIIGIEDTRTMGGPDFVYRIEIEPIRDRIVSQLTTSQNYLYQYYLRLDLPQGGRFTRNITLSAAQGTILKGDYELEAVGLPAGVTMIAPRFNKDNLTMPVQFVVDPGVKPQGGLIELCARPIDKTAHVEAGSTQAMTFNDRRGGYAWHYVFLDKIAFAITDPAPYSIEAIQPDVALVQSGELSVEVKVKRNGDFKGPIEIQTDWLPGGVTRESGVTIPAGVDSGKLTFQATSKTPPGSYRVAIVATTLAGDRESGTGNIRVSSGFFDLRVAEPFLTVQIPRSSVERGQKGKIVCEVKQNKAFPGEAVCTLKRLPHGVTVVEPLPKITVKDKIVTFNIDAAPEALVGLYREIFCEVTLTENGQSIRQQSGSGVLRVDPSRRGKAVSSAEAPKK